MKKEKGVIRIPIVVPIVIAFLVAIIMTSLLGTQLITNAARYTASNTVATEDGNFEYEELEDGTIKITAYYGTETYLTIPATLDGKTVSIIGDDSFGGCTSLRHIKISEGITYIGESAFYACINLRKIEIPESVTYIGPDAFYGCINLKSVEVNKNNTVFMSDNGILFNEEKTAILRYPAGKEDTTYKIPEGITHIGYAAFDDCINLQTIEIPEGVTSIGSYAFWYCTNLRNIEIPKTVTDIGGEAFEHCTNLTSIEISESTTNITEYTFNESKIIKAINTENAATQEIELPDIIKRAMDENDILYSSEGIKFTNCELSDDNTKIIVDAEKVKEESVSVYVYNGALGGVTIEIVPSGTITYAQSDWTSYGPVRINVMAILHLAEGEKITNNNGENTYAFTKNGEFIFEYTDANGNAKTSTSVVDWMWEFTWEGKYLTEIDPETTANELKANAIIDTELEEGEAVKIYNNEQEEMADSDFVGTGMKLCFTENDEIVQEYTVVIRGDTNGDGEADFKDMLKVNSHRLDKNILEGAYLIAGDVTEDGVVDFKDLVRINKFRLHKIAEL